MDDEGCVRQVVLCASVKAGLSRREEGGVSRVKRSMSS